MVKLQSYTDEHSIEIRNMNFELIHSFDCELCTHNEGIRGADVANVQKDRISYPI